MQIVGDPVFSTNIMPAYFIYHVSHHYLYKITYTLSQVRKKYDLAYIQCMYCPMLLYPNIHKDSSSISLEAQNPRMNQLRRLLPKSCAPVLSSTGKMCEVQLVTPRAFHGQRPHQPKSIETCLHCLPNSILIKDVKK